MSSTRLLVFLALLAQAALLARSARADPYEAAVTRAVVAKERALDLGGPAAWQEALRLFGEADALRSTFETKYEIGFAAERMRQADLAVEAYEHALELGLAGTARERASAFVALHAPGLARIELSGAPGTLVIVNGIERAFLPVSRALVVFPGELTLSLVHPDGQRSAVSVRASAGETRVVEMVSPPEPVRVELPAAPATPRSPAPARSRLVRREPGPDGVSSGWALAGGGLFAGALAAVVIPVAGSNIASSRRKLRNYCDVPSGPDACANALPGRVDDAQSEVDAIASWKAARVGSWIAVGLGAVAAGAGVALSSGLVELRAAPDPNGARFYASADF